MFLRPSINPTPECNLWGPLCQTGTIVVDVKIKSTTTQTTVSCSDYLSAQPRTLSPLKYGDDRSPFKSSFLSSPECTSYAKWYDAKQSFRVEPVLSYSNCPSILTKPLEDYLPFEFSKGNDLPPHYPVGDEAPTQYCCGPCAILIDEIRVLYFPDQSPVLCSNESLQTGQIKSNVTSIVTSSLQTNQNRADSLQTDAYRIAILDGHTL